MLNGDPTVPCGLTELGERQARALGERVGPIDVALHTSFERTRRTAELAWPTAPKAVLADLDEIRFGRWEGTVWNDGYVDWVATAGPEEESPGGGESRVAAVRRYVRGYRAVLDRPEQRVALVTHGAPVRYLLLAAAAGAPTALLEQVPPAEPFVLEHDEVVAAVERLERWLDAPAF